MTFEEREKQDLLKQEFRYAIVSELANPYLSREEIKRLIAEKAKREYDMPWSKKNRIKPRTIEKWLQIYKKHGKEGLMPKRRSDNGCPRSISREEADALLNYLEEHPEITATGAVTILCAQGKIKTRISQSSLSRLVQAHNLDRKRRKEKVAMEKNLKFDFFKPLECVQADVLHAFPMKTEKGKEKKVKLIAFIDDATRRILYANFSFSEESLEFERGIKHILKTHGKIGKLYVDNGSSFVSLQTQRILAILGIHLIHSRPYKPAGRGKIERYFRTVRDQFLRLLTDIDIDIQSLADLNMRFAIWLESEYHRNPHKGLQGSTPLDMWLAKAKYIIRMDPTISLDEVFLHEDKRKVYKDNTITVHGTLYEVPAILAGKKVKIKYEPGEKLAEIKVYCEGEYHGIAQIVDSYANTKVKRNINSKALETMSVPLKDQDNSKPSDRTSVGIMLSAADVQL